MHDPFPIPPPEFLQRLVTPFSQTLYLPTLPLHIHEILLAYAVYHLTMTHVSPLVSTFLFPASYPSLPPRTRVNWDVHVVSLLQSTLINVLALWVMWVDAERAGMDQKERVLGYTGAGGMIQGFATGYFLWDLIVSWRYLDLFGFGLLAHAVSALVVFSLGFVSTFLFPFLFDCGRRSGFSLSTPSIRLRRNKYGANELWYLQRPFVHYYGPTFILYELSSPFLNFHWFFDKLHMTGSKAQLYNGLMLLATFFSCRLVWGTYQSIRVYQDVWAALQNPGPGYRRSSASAAGDEDDMMRFSGSQVVPVWLAITYLGSNVILNTLNFYWFGKMIEAVRKRFSTKPTEKTTELVEGVELSGVEDEDEDEDGEKDEEESEDDEEEDDDEDDEDDDEDVRAAEKDTAVELNLNEKNNEIRRRKA
ncbi:MAG: hypothetical protein M1813_008242 [Trichoglossum hirsutum]|nr:MAG: hypothetical protein M1813_008242 [Trichoglossum hirsutum]